MKEKNKEKKLVAETIKTLESLASKDSTFAPPILALLKSMNPEMRAFYAQMTSEALDAAKAISNAPTDSDFVNYANDKKKNG